MARYRAGERRPASARGRASSAPGRRTTHHSKPEHPAGDITLKQRAGTRACRVLESKQTEWEVPAHEKLKDIETRLKSLPPGDVETFLKDIQMQKPSVTGKTSGTLNDGRATNQQSDLASPSEHGAGQGKVVRKIAEAIEAAVTADGQDTYPLHAAVMMPVN